MNYVIYYLVSNQLIMSVNPHVAFTISPLAQSTYVFIHWNIIVS